MVKNSFTFDLKKQRDSNRLERTQEEKRIHLSGTFFLVVTLLGISCVTTSIRRPLHLPVVSDSRW